MLFNYINIAFRNIKRQKGFSFLNIAGLSLGLTCFLLILIWIQYELSYDRFHENSNDICSVLIQRNNKGTEEFVYGALPAALKEEIPEIINSARLAPLWPLNKNAIKYKENSFVLTGNVTDPTFFDIFTFPLLKGNPQTALSEPNSIVLTEETAAILFGDEDPLNKSIQFELWGKWQDVKISGILKDFPENSTIKFDFAVPSSLMKRFRQTFDDWDDICSPAYVLLQKDVSYKSLNDKLKGFIVRHRPESNYTVHLFPFTKNHLHNYAGGGAIIYIYIFSVIGILILLLAIINYMNLSTARSISRAKEIGIRKAVGANRSRLVSQFLSESIIITVLAFGFSLIILQLLIPIVNNILESNLDMACSGEFTLFIIGIVIFTGIISGSYPALYLSNIEPVNILKGTRKSGSKSIVFRKILILNQFTVSILLIVCAVIAYRQLNYISSKDLGFNKEYVINLEMRGSFFQYWEIIKEQLLQCPNILSVTAANTSFINFEKATDSAQWEGKNDDEKIIMEVYPVDYDYLKTFDMKMAEGRYFSEEHPSDAMEGIVLNESAIKAMGMNSPIGKRFNCFLGEEFRQSEIIGIVKDFNFRSLHNEIEPVIFAIAPWWYNEFYIKLDSGNSGISESIRFIEKKVKEYVPDYPFEYSILDEDIARLYKAEKRAEIFVKYGASLAIIIACLGLVGLVSCDAELKTKEVGIRKVLGASNPGIFLLMAKGYLKWILLANIIAWPAAWYAMNKWLQSFAYRIDIGWWIFILAGLLALIIAIFTMSFQAIKVAWTNPVEALRHE